MKKLIFNAIIVPTLAVTLGGCHGPDKRFAGKAPQFVKGWHDGCRSAQRYWQNNLGPYRIVDPKLKEDPRYKEGWEYGYNECYAQTETEIWMSRPRR